MEAVHCFRCFRFPSSSLDFYITNCMHIFCVDCKQLCEPSVLDAPKCIECATQPIRILKMGPNMPDQVRNMFTPISEDIAAIQRDFTRVYTFQYRQRRNLLNGLTKKEKNFDRLRDALKAEREKKENYKQQIERASQLIQSQELEISQLRQSLQQAPPTSSQAPPTLGQAPPTVTTPLMVRVFSDSMYTQQQQHEKAAGIRKSVELLSASKRQKTMEIPPFSKQKSQTCAPSQKLQHHAPPRGDDDNSNFVTPHQPPKNSAHGFTTPANPPHMFPFLKKFEQRSGSSSKHHQQTSQ